MVDKSVSAHVTSTLRRIEELSARYDDDNADDSALPEVLSTLSQTLSELEVSSEELQAQNAELHAARQIIERERARFQDLFDQAPEPYLITNATGVITASNRQAQQLLGRSESRLEGKPLAVFVAEEDTPDFRRVLNWLADGYGMNSWELCLQTDDGAATVLASVEPMAGRDGDTELRWMLADATSTMIARRRMNDLLEATRRDASELKVMTEWQATLLGAAAHDLRTPLSAIDAELSSAIGHDAVAEHPDLAAHLDQAAAVLSKLRRLLPSLLDLSRLQATNVVAQRSTVVLSDLIEQVRGILSLSEDRLTLDLEVDDLEADRLQLERILENLIGNAVRHTPEGTPVRIRSRPKGVDVLLIVDDAGDGVPEELRDDIFSPFTRITIEDRRPEQVTSGLGLTLVSMFAAMHGGRAWVESSDMGGASFRVLLSAALEDDT